MPPDQVRAHGLVYSKLLLNVGVRFSYCCYKLVASPSFFRTGEKILCL